MRKEDAFEHFDLVAFAAGHHGRDEISGTVVAEAGGFLPGRTVVGAGDVGDVVLEVMFLKTELRGVGIERFGEQRADIAHGFFALAQANKVQDLRRTSKSVLNFLGEVRVAVLADGDVVDVTNFRADCVETRLHRERWKSAEMFMTVEALLGDGEDDFSIAHDGGGGVGVKHVEAENQHERRAGTKLDSSGVVGVKESSVRAGRVKSRIDEGGGVNGQAFSGGN